MSRNRDKFLNLFGIIIVAIYLFPVYWMFNTSLKTNNEIFANPSTFFPHVVTILSYLEQSKGILLYFFNSMYTSIFTTLLTLILAVPAAYGIAKYRIKGRGIILLSFLVAQMLPGAVLLTPLFISFKSAGILNTQYAPILANATATIPFSIIMLRPYFLNVPSELEESARIDGCNNIMSFLRIVVPISYPVLIICGALSFLMSWGNLIFPLTFLTDENKWPMTVTIYRAIGQYGTQWNDLMAFATIVTLPVIIMFMFAQKYLISGLTAGALKE
ncbi:carbohydrate ABC transporter membrane protein 2 (CUT1 family) [Thermohydrogenium kirishiense]|nr:carbohydrate ABC transporter membrane protein 2 (CUT1 family) [Thermohydrogenium kirishiense]